MQAAPCGLCMRVGLWPEAQPAAQPNTIVAHYDGLLPANPGAQLTSC